MSKLRVVSHIAKTYEDSENSSCILRQ